jgi:hypothetical protein
MKTPTARRRCDIVTAANGFGREPQDVTAAALAP